MPQLPDHAVAQTLLRPCFSYCRRDRLSLHVVSPLSFSIFPFFPSFFSQNPQLSLLTSPPNITKTENLEQTQEVCKVSSKTFLRTPYCCHSSFPSPQPLLLAFSSVQLEFQCSMHQTNLFTGSRMKSGKTQTSRTVTSTKLQAEMLVWGLWDKKI